MFCRLALFALVLCALPLSACQQKAQSAVPFTDEDVAAIRSRVASFGKAMMTADWPGIMSIYTEDAIVLPPNAPMVQGRAAIQKFFEGFPKIAEWKQNVTEIEGQGDLAFHRDTYEIAMLPPGARTPVKDGGKGLVVWRKQPDGSWLVSRVVWNSDLAPTR